MRIQGSRIQEAKYQPKTAKKTVLRVKPKSELLKKKIIKISLMVHQVLHKKSEERRK